MKKLLTIVVVLLFASTAFAQGLNIQNRNVDSKTAKEVMKQLVDDAKQGSETAVRGMNHKLFNKKKEFGMLKSDRAQVPHPPADNDDEVFFNGFEVAGGSGYNFGSASGGNVEATTFNAPGTVGNLVWWFGTNDPTYEQPGYGADWGIFLQHSNLDFQLQPSLASASIRFDGFYNLEVGWDAAHLQVSTDGGVTWEWVECWSGDTDGQWVNGIDVDVSDYIGEYITFRFVLISDGGFDSEDGEVGSFENPGGFFIENLYVVRNGVKELVSDAGDTKSNMFSGNYSPAFLWARTDTYAASGDWSAGYAEDEVYEPGSVYFYGVDVNLDVATTLGGNDVAPLWLDFDVFSTMPESQADGGFDYWAPYLIDWNAGAVVALSDFVYVGPFGDDGDFVAYSDNFGYIDLSDFIDNDDLTIGVLFASNGSCSFGEGEFYFDNVSVIQKNDPYEYNDDEDTATSISYGFMSEFANIWDIGESDWYYFTGSEGDWVDIYVDNSQVDTYIELYSAATNESVDDFLGWDDYVGYDRIIKRLPVSGGYFILVQGMAGEKGAYDMWLDMLDPTGPVTSVTDFAGDQGKVVTLTFTPAELDNYTDEDFTRWGAQAQSYQIERKKNVISSDYDVVAQLEAFGLSADGQTYRVQVPTVFDSANTTYRVRSKVGIGEVNAMGWYVGLYTYLGAEGSGQSYDNIAPVFNLQYTAAPQSGTGIDVGAEVDYGGGNGGVSDLVFYNIYRGLSADFTPSLDNLIATIETHNTSVRYNDAEYDGNTAFYYIIEVVDDGGNKVFSDVVNTTTGVEDEAVPTVYSLSQNYPNPFNPATTIKFGIPQAADVTVKIYDILGQEVKTLMNRNLAAGFHTVNFDASNLISGMYIYRIQANGVDGSNFTDVKKMLLVK